MPLLSVYNNLIHGYAMSHQTRFDSHKRSELNDVYRRMRKMNCEQPLYRIEFDEEVQEYTLTMKEQALGLSAMVKELGARDGYGVFSSKILESDNPSEVSVEVLAGASENIGSKLVVEVSALSSPQVNDGRLVAAKEIGINAGQYSFTVEVEGGYYSFQFNVNGASTNHELQNKLADFINKTKVGLKARVVDEWVTGRSRLEIQAKNDSSKFAFKDTKTPSYQKGGIVEFFGLNEITKPAETTKATINGNQVESRDREYVTNNGLKLVFYGVTNEPVVIREVSDEKAVMKKVSEFVDKFNNLSDFVRTGSATRRASKKLYYDMNATISRFRKELNGIGIDFSEAGTGAICIDTEAMAKAVRDGSAEALFRENSPVSSGLIRKFSDVSLNPMDYVDKMIVVYPNTRVSRSYNPYITSIYSGLMYNNYC